MRSHPQFLSALAGAAALVLACAPCGGATADAHKVLDPEKSQHLFESAHFVARWNDNDGVTLSDEELRKGLATLEGIREFYLGKVGFDAPYANQAVKYKASVNLSNKGWATGAGTGKNDPAMWLHFNAFKDQHALAHEFAHSLQFATMGLRDSPFVGWSWESQAEWMTHQMFPDQVGCSDQLVNAPHLYYGSTRDRYGNWQFWEYIKDTFGYAAINDIWSKATKPGTPETALEDPLVVLARNQRWKTSELNDQFGRWAMHNVTWDYKNGEVYRKCYGSYDDLGGIRRNRVSILEPIDSKKGRFAIPNYRAPQRFGYNLIPIDPDLTGKSRGVTVNFRGIVQKEPGVKKFEGNFENEPKSVPKPCSDWRWGLVAVDEKGNPRYSALQRGAASEATITLRANEKQVWLVVVATPTEYQRISWDQMYYAIYRYPWMVEIRGGRPRGSETASAAKSAGRKGAPHPNGGGWVDATAHADPSAYVGPAAMVLDGAQVLGKARIDDQAVVSGNAKISDNATVRGHALVTGNGIIAGNARIEDEASVYGGTINEEARLGALTLVEGDHTRIRGKADLAAVMNSIRDADLSGTVRLIGDIELNTRSISKGVFYGMVNAEMISNPRWGADRTEPATEVTSTLTAAKPR
ncbi:MAG: DUF6055 domain-containing protein [Akkermansiaceae bacterium]|nr:DUF6055 domain-containing protein [Akkermansiaceae bacterium]